MASWNEQTPLTASAVGRYSDASSDHCNHHIIKVGLPHT